MDNQESVGRPYRGSYRQYPNSPPPSNGQQQHESPTPFMKRESPLPLSAMEEHYLKRELIRLQLNYELSVLSDFRQIGRLGYPFKPATDAPLNDPNSDFSMPILRHVFAHHIRTFPFISVGLDKKGSPSSKEFWQDTVQQFLEIWGEKDLSSSEDREEATKRKRIGNKLTSLIAIYMSSGLQTTNPNEKTAKISDTGTRSATNSAISAQEDGSAGAKSGVQNIDPEALARELSDAPHFSNGIDINVVGAYMVRGKKKAAGLSNLGGLFPVSDDHAEFIIRSRMAHPDHKHDEPQDSELNARLRSDMPVIYVSRRFSDFQDLDNKLAKEFTKIELPRFPSKNKASTSLSSNDPKSPTLDPEDDMTLDNDDDMVFYPEGDPVQLSPNAPASEPSGSSNFDIQQQFLNLSMNTKALFNKKQTPSTPPSQTANATNSQPAIKLIREKQRLSFRAYLRGLIAIPSIAKSQTLLEFLFRDQIRGKLTEEQQDDIARRRMMDIKRVEDQLEFLRLATARARDLEVHLTDFKQELMEPNGLQNIFMEIHTKATIQDLSPRFRLFLEWASVEFSATLYSMFVAEDSSPDLFSQITRIHKLMPYSVLKGILRWSNPVAIMKGVIDLFLAQPFGKRSLLQNIFYMVLQEDIKNQDRQINSVKKCLTQKHAEIITTVLEAYLNASPAVREEIRLSTKTEENVFQGENEGHADLVVAIFQNSRRLVPDGEVAQDEVSLLVQAWYEAWNNAVEKNKSDSSQTTQYEDDYISAYTATRDLLHLMMRRSDKDKLQALWNEPQTMSLIKDLFTIFYSPLVELFKSSKVHEAVGDFESFMDDLIKVVKQSESSVLTRGPNEMVEEFVNLCHRHLPSLYRFIHEMYVNDKGHLFDGIMKWLSDIVQFLRYGVLDSADTDDSAWDSSFNEKVIHKVARKLDLNKIVQNAQVSSGVDPLLVVNEMDSLISWLQKRKEWMKQQENLAKEVSSGPKLGMSWDSAIPTSNEIDGNAFGFADDDFTTFEMLNGDDDQDSDLASTDVPLSPTYSQGTKASGAGTSSLSKLKFGHRRTGSNSSTVSSRSNNSNVGGGVGLYANNGQQSALEAERERREKLLTRLEKAKKMPQRPSVEEALKLRKEFAKELVEVLFVA